MSVGRMQAKTSAEDVEIVDACWRVYIAETGWPHRAGGPPARKHSVNSRFGDVNRVIN